MKKILNPLLFLIITLSLFILNPVSIKAFEWTDCLNTEIVDEDLHSYKIYQGKVYYEYCLLPDLDPKTLHTFAANDPTTFPYAKDKNNVYFQWFKLEKLNPNTFKTKKLAGNYLVLHDKNNVYINGSYVPNGDAETLEYLDTDNSNGGISYFKDKGQVYKEELDYVDGGDVSHYKISVLDNAYPAFFSFGYNITPDAVYWYGKKIEGVDVGSFEVYDWAQWSHDAQYAHDKNNVYIKDKIVYGVNVRSFQTYDIKRENQPTLQLEFDANKAILIKKEYPKESSKINQSLSSAIKAYETKYPSYTPQPAMPKPGSPEEQALKKFQADVAKAKLEEAEENKQNMIKIGIISIVSALGLGGIVYGDMRRMGKRKK